MNKTHQVGDDLADTSYTCQWQVAFLKNFMFSVLVDMVHKYDNLSAFWVRDKIHGTTHPFNDLLRDHIISEVTRRRNL